MMRRLGLIAMLVVLVIWTRPALAHATLLRAEPPPNTILDSAPAEIRLTFSEPLEARFSRITLRGADGSAVGTPLIEIPESDRATMILRPGDLPDGLYTLSWRALSAADGHATQGSYALTIGAAASAPAPAAALTERGVLEAAFVRLLNLLSLALLVGGLGFWRLAWLPQREARIEAQMRQLVWAGWALVGATSLLLLAMQWVIVMDSPLPDALASDNLRALLLETRFGGLMLARLALWLLAGAALRFAPERPALALLVSLCILPTNSLFSHASADTLASAAADALHLAATALWVGGLFQLMNVFGLVRRRFQPAAPLLGRLVARFSNVARVAVAILIITGLYAAWLHVGSIPALTGTAYGQTLLVKLALVVPLLALAAVNLFLTQRGLKAGREVWSARLRRLVGGEILLTIGVLAAVGVMASVEPARSAAAAVPPAQPFSETLAADDLTITLDITPGYVGLNRFALSVRDAAGAAVTDASLVRLRFDYAPHDMGQSELRPTIEAGGVYAASGANLSAPGEWRVRASIQRPGQFDTVVDFRPQPQPAPLPPDSRPRRDERAAALLVTGAAALVVGLLAAIFPLPLPRRTPRPGGRALASALAAFGAFLLGTGMPMLPAPAPVFEDDVPVKLLAAHAGAPYLLTAAGGLLLPGMGGAWHPAPLDARVNRVYGDASGQLWASADSGLYFYDGAAWLHVDERPAAGLEVTHGEVFAFNAGALCVVSQGGTEPREVRHLNAPLPGETPSAMVMLGDHSHALLTGGQVFHSVDLGLSWMPLAAPAPVRTLATDAGGNLLAANESDVYTWDRVGGTWSRALPLPDGGVPILRVFDDRLYALSGGRLFAQAGGAWQAVDVPGGGYLTALDVQYPGTLWLLDAQGRRVLSSADGAVWLVSAISIPLG